MKSTKRALLVTIFKVPNYGSMLQAVISNFAPPNFRKLKPPEIGKVKPPIVKNVKLGTRKCIIKGKNSLLL